MHPLDYVNLRLTEWLLEQELEEQDYTSQSAGREVPVTPGVHHTGQTTYFEKRPSTAASEKKAFDPAGATLGPQWSSNSSYLEHEEESEGISLIRRIAMARNDDQGGNITSKDPVSQYPSLGLSGRIISATFNVPYTIGYSPGNAWVNSLDFCPQSKILSS
jgi:trehalose 6-phosphate synthase/phosphatase